MKMVWFCITLFAASVLVLSCTLTSENPDVLHVSIKDGQVIDDIESFHTISVSFSMAMNRYPTEKQISITGYYGALHYKWNDHYSDVDIVLEEGLERGRRYVLKIGKSCESKEGFDLGSDYSYSFYTYSGEDDFFVVSTKPADGAQVTMLDNVIVSITFSQPVDYVTLYDKIEFDPALSYSYSFSDDRRVLHLAIAEHLEAHELYTVTIRDDLVDSGGKALNAEYMFSFNTFFTEAPFSIERAVMVPEWEGPPGTELDIKYLGRTVGIEKDCDLLVFFSEEFYLHSIDSFIGIEPALSYYLTKEDRVLRFTFEEDMEPEKLYRITFQKSMKNVYGIGLDRDYSFEWKVNGTASTLLRLSSIVNIDPNGIQDITLYDGVIAFQNEDILYLPDSLEIDKNNVDFEIRFSTIIDIYRSLDKFYLTFLYGGDSSSLSGVLTGYSWDGDEKKLVLRFTLPSLQSANDAYYKLIVTGGAEGVLDRDGNYMEESLEIYVKYSFSG